MSYYPNNQNPYGQQTPIYGQFPHSNGNNPPNGQQPASDQYLPPYEQQHVYGPPPFIQPYYGPPPPPPYVQHYYGPPPPPFIQPYYGPPPLHVPPENTCWTKLPPPTIVSIFSKEISSEDSDPTPTISKVIFLLGTILTVISPLLIF